MKRSFLLVTFLCAVFLVVGGQALKESEDRAPRQLLFDEADVYAVAQNQDGKNKKTVPLKQDRTPKQFPRQPIIFTGAAPYPSYLLPATFGIGPQLFNVPAVAEPVRLYPPVRQEPLVGGDLDSVKTRVGSAPAPNKRTRPLRNPLTEGSSLTRQVGPCNDLETEINKERARNGLGPLKCDPNMRWVANKHVENQLDNGYTDGQEFPNGCNGHSWLGAVSCCFSISSEATWPCMWNKPLELSKWDDRNGYEISAWSSGTITPSGAVDSWRGSSAHHNVILTQGSWTDLQTVGCAWRNTVAHCWFAKTEP